MIWSGDTDMAVRVSEESNSVKGHCKGGGHWVAYSGIWIGNVLVPAAALY